MMVSSIQNFRRNCRSIQTVISVVIILVACTLISAYWSSSPNWVIQISSKQRLTIITSQKHITPFKDRIILNCKSGNLTKSCPVDENPTYSSSGRMKNGTNRDSCPAYFRWMYEDLRPWTNTGISINMVERAKPYAHFRLIILNGRVYIERYNKSFQTRDVFTIWGILQLLRRYPGQLQDLDLMFNCEDRPRIMKRKHANNSGPPPLFGYCRRIGALALVFPDWSFWGWPEINIKPWESLLKELKEGNEKLKWIDREPYAFWKGNPLVNARRYELLKCNVTETKDWNARVYALDWQPETRRGFKDTNLANQCSYRYKIYVEGQAWSVSQKYILACDSMTLLLEPQYHDFFTRGLMPMQHYWPVRAGNNDCSSIKYAVDWGNSHQQLAQSIGKEASTFIQQEVKMDYVYDYMLHLLNEYAKLLKYKPKIPPGAQQVCMESIACAARGLERKFMLDSMVKSPSNSNPCEMQ